jgi:2-oxoglutarate ferredoxin oxidoreductase subunit beta
MYWSSTQRARPLWGKIRPINRVDGSLITLAQIEKICRGFWHELQEVVALSSGSWGQFCGQGGVAVHPRQLEKVILEALGHNGFSVVEAISQCPTYFARKNKPGSLVGILQWQKENTTFKADDGDKIPLGILVKTERPAYKIERSAAE